jgi:hypothetical protein
MHRNSSTKHPNLLPATPTGGGGGLLAGQRGRPGRGGDGPEEDRAGDAEAEDKRPSRG